MGSYVCSSASKTTTNDATTVDEATTATTEGAAVAETTNADSVLDYVTRTELAGLQALAAVARCCQTHALSSEVQAALSWIADVEDAADADKAPTAVGRYLCRIEDSDGTAVATGFPEQQARDRAFVRFEEDHGRRPSSSANVSVIPHTG